MKRILITKEKGGVGSTTTATNLAYELAQRGFAVLLVDLDTRGDCAGCFGLDPLPLLGDALAGRIHDERTAVAKVREGLDLISTNTSGTLAAMAMVDEWPEGDRALALSGLGEGAAGFGYDFVIFDSSAASGVLRRAAMQVADLMVLPTRVEALGMPDLAALIEAYGQPQLVIVLPVAYRRQLSVHQYNLGLLAERYGERLAMPVPDRVAVIESHSAMQPVLAYAPENDASACYRRFVDDVLATLEDLAGDCVPGEAICVS